MVWFRVDDVLPFHARVIEAGNAAMGLWVRAGALSAGQLTDGFITEATARTLGTAKEIRRLVAVGLWHEVEGGYQFHAWAEDGTGTKRQPTRAEVEAQRRADRDRKAAYRESRREHRPDGPGTPPAVPAGVPLGHPLGHPSDSGDVSRHPDPTRPDPTHKEQEKRSPSGDLSTDRTADAARSAPSESQEVALIEAPGPRAAARPTGAYPAAFEEFWHAYPRHEGKRNALAAWLRAIRRSTTAEVLDGARRYAADPNRDDQFTAHATTWLNRDGWHDAPLPKRGPQSQYDRLQQQTQDTHEALARMGIA